MNKIILSIIAFSFVFSDVLIKGTISDDEGNPIPYANVYLKDTFDGIS